MYRANDFLVCYNIDGDNMIIFPNKQQFLFSKKQLNHATTVMAKAFETHPYIGEVFGYRTLKRMFKLFLKVIQKDGDIFVKEVESKEIGYITFLPSVNGKDILPMSVIKYALWDFLILIVMLVPKLGKVIGYLSRFDKKDMIEGKNIHLMQTGIDPRYKGNGYMSELFELSSSYYQSYDNIILETTDPDNKGLYEHFGFEMIQKIDTLMVFRKKLED